MQSIVELQRLYSTLLDGAFEMPFISRLWAPMVRLTPGPTSRDLLPLDGDFPFFVLETDEPETHRVRGLAVRSLGYNPSEVDRELQLAGDLARREKSRLLELSAAELLTHQ